MPLRVSQRSPRPSRQGWKPERVKTRPKPGFQRSRQPSPAGRRTVNPMRMERPGAWKREHDPKKVCSGFPPATNAKRVCAEIMLKQKRKRDDDSSRSIAL